MSFIMFMELPVCVNLHNILTFLEYLFKNHISPKVIGNYLSFVRLMAHQYKYHKVMLTTMPSPITLGPFQ